MQGNMIKSSCCHYPIRQRKGGASLELLISFLISVIAGIACHYICKWLDGDNSDN